MNICFTDANFIILHFTNIKEYKISLLLEKLNYRLLKEKWCNPAAHLFLMLNEKKICT